MKKFLIIQLRPEDDVSDNEFEAFLRVGDIESVDVERLRIEKTGIPEDIDPRDYRAIIVGGSPFDITTPEDQKSDIQKKIEKDFMRFLEIVVKNDVPFLGACSGNGLLGKYCGVDLSGKYGEAVGGVDLTMTEEGESDPLLRGVSKTFRALVGHKEACDDVPDGAVLLASSATCPVQMFRVGKNVYATQFHPEADKDVFITRIHAYKNHGYFAPEDAQKLIDALEDEDVRDSQKVLANFVRRYQ